MIEQLAIRRETKHPWSRMEIDEHALRAILEIPAPTVVEAVISLDESHCRPVGDGLTFEQPTSATIKRKPAEYRGHVGPAGHRANDALIHEGACNYRNAGTMPGKIR